MATVKTGRNAPCPCGSGRKYKHCCARRPDQMSRLGWAVIGGILVGMTAVLFYSFSGERGSGSRQVWDPDHGHFHTIP